MPFETMKIVESFSGGVKRRICDNRCANRAPYDGHVYIAAFEEGNDYPGRNHFVVAVCRDISCCGIFVYLSAIPPTKTVILQIGSEPRIILLAKVVRATNGFYLGRRQFCLACKFVRRVKDFPKLNLAS